MKRNAIILAAGKSSRFAPLSYEKPKGLLKVKGEILIERQINQLIQAGISDITVVAGYMANAFMYLKEKYDIKIVMNEDYYRYNNTSSVIRVIEKLGNTYLCSSDNYFLENVFLENPNDSYYSALFAEGDTEEYCLTTDYDDNIINVKAGGRDAWYMVGHVYFNQEFSEKFSIILKREYDNFETRQGYWEDVYARHISELPLMKIHRYKPNVIKEFDTLEELRQFDISYLNHTGCEMFKNICKVLQCEEKDITNIDILKKGMTNCSFAFTCSKDNKKYVYRHPGAGTESFINRENESYSLQIAKDLGLDNTYIYMHPKKGWKISEYIENAETLNSVTIQRKDNLDSIAKIYKKLHNSNIKLHNTFNIFSEIEKYDQIAKKIGANMYEGWETVKEDITDLESKLKKLEIDVRPCHNDAVAENFIKSPDGSLSLIDWEYSGMNDPMADFAALFLESGFTDDHQIHILNEYYSNSIPSNAREKINCFEILWDFLWAQWSVIKEAKGDDFGSYGRNRYDRAIKNLNTLKSNR